MVCWALSAQPLSVTLTMFRCHCSVSFYWKFSVLIWLNWNFVWVFISLYRSWMHHGFWRLLEEIIDMFCDWTKTSTLPFFSDTAVWNFAWLYYWPSPCFKVTGVLEKYMQIAVYHVYFTCLVLFKLCMVVAYMERLCTICFVWL